MQTPWYSKKEVEGITDIKSYSKKRRLKFYSHVKTKKNATNNAKTVKIE